MFSGLLLVPLGAVSEAKGQQMEPEAYTPLSAPIGLPGDHASLWPSGS